MVMWTKKVLRCTETIIFLVKGLKVVAICYFFNCYFFFFNDDLYCCAKYSNVEIKLRSSILSIKCDAQKQMIEFGFGPRVHDLNYFEVGYSIILEFIIHLRASSQNYVILCNFIIFCTITCSILSISTPLAPKLCRFFLGFFVIIICLAL